MKRREFLQLTAGAALGLAVRPSSAMPAGEPSEEAPAAPPKSELVYLSLHSMAALIKMRRVSSVELLQAHLDQIDKHNKSLNAIVTMAPEKAMASAREADEALAKGEYWGPLHGIPVTIKDALETKGMRTTAGFVPLKDYVPKEDATVVARLRAAGAIILGKTNMPKLAAGYYTDNEVFGMTNNPWNVAYTPGGSTGGGAAAVASCMSPLEIGSDLAGSVRWPAHCCGLFGLKPTEWRVSWSGHIPDLPGKPRGLRHMLALGPLARTVEDLVIALKLISGPDAKIWEVPPAPLLDPGKVPLKGLKVGYVPQFGSLTTTKETREGLDKLASGLASHGAHVEQAEITGFDFQTYDSVFERIFEGELSAANPRPTTPTMQDYTLALAQKDAFMAVMDAFLANYDVMLCPAAARQAFRHDSSPNTQDIDGKSVDYGDAAGWYCRPFNLTGNPAVVLPLFQGKDGLPIGLQLVGRRWSEMRLLAIAASITEVSREFVHPPGY